MADYIHGRVTKLLLATSLAHHWASLDMEYGGLNHALWQVAPVWTAAAEETSFVVTPSAPYCTS